MKDQTMSHVFGIICKWGLLLPIFGLMFFVFLFALFFTANTSADYLYIAIGLIFVPVKFHEMYWKDLKADWKFVIALQKP